MVETYSPPLRIKLENCLWRKADPVAALRAAWAKVPPGGRLTVIESDRTGIRSLPPEPDMERAMRLLRHVWRRQGGDLECGARMASLFDEAGIGTPDGSEASGSVWGNAQARRYLETSLHESADELQAHGVVNAAGLQALVTALQDSPTHHATLRGPDRVVTWKDRRPADATTVAPTRPGVRDAEATLSPMLSFVMPPMIDRRCAFGLS